MVSFAEERFYEEKQEQYAGGMYATSQCRWLMFDWGNDISPTTDIDSKLFIENMYCDMSTVNLPKQDMPYYRDTMVPANLCNYNAIFSLDLMQQHLARVGFNPSLQYALKGFLSVK